MGAVTVHSNSGAQENKVCHCFHFFPIYLPWSDRTRCHEISFLKMLRFKPGFSLSSFAFIKRLFSSSSLSAVRVVSSTYLKLLVFPLAVLIPAYDSSSLAFHIMYSAYNLNKQGTIYSLEVLLSQLEPACSSMSGSCYCFFLHTGFSRGRSGGLVSSLSEFSTVYCDPHTQRLWHSQQNRNRCFSGTLLLFPWSSGCWQFDLWFLCLF